MKISEERGPRSLLGSQEVGSGSRKWDWEDLFKMGLEYPVAMEQLMIQGCRRKRAPEADERKLGLSPTVTGGKMGCGTQMEAG